MGKFTLSDALFNGLVDSMERGEEMKYMMHGDQWRGLGKLLEENGELTEKLGRLNVLLGKLIVNGGDTDYWGDRDLLDELHNEIADVMASLQYFVDENEIFDTDRIVKRALEKLDKYQSWKDNKE